MLMVTCDYLFWWVIICGYFMKIDGYLWLFILMDDYLQLFVIILCAWIIVWGHIADYFVKIIKIIQIYVNLCNKWCFNNKKCFYYYWVV